MKHQKTANQMLQNYLRDGEMIYWEGKTEPFSLLEKDAKNTILMKWIGTVVAVSAFLWLYTGNNKDWSITTVIGVLVIGILLLFSPMIERNNLLKQLYWITDQRVIMMSGDKSLCAMELENLKGFRVERERTKNPTLVLGEVLFEEGNRQLRWRGCHPKMDSQSASSGKSVVEGLVLYSITDGVKAEDCLNQLVHSYQK